MIDGDFDIARVGADFAVATPHAAGGNINVTRITFDIENLLVFKAAFYISCIGCNENIWATEVVKGDIAGASFYIGTVTCV